jgi:hypothetical protein
MELALPLLRSRRTRWALQAAALALSLGLTLLAARWLATRGFPLAHAEPELVAATAALFLVALAVKSHAWSRLFRPQERPSSTTLAAATGAAAVLGIALPGRVDDAARIAIVRWLTGRRTAVSTTAFSLFALGLVDVIALTPLASAGATSSGSPAIQAGLAVVAFAGVGAAGVVVLLPRLADGGLARFRLVAWLAAQAPTMRDASRAVVLVAGAWMLRGVGIYLLLHALGVHLSFLAALVYVCASAAASALPTGLAGAFSGAGAGAAVLVASGIDAGQALTVALSVQLLGAMVGAAAVLAAAAWHGVGRIRLAVA